MILPAQQGARAGLYPGSRHPHSWLSKSLSEHIMNSTTKNIISLVIVLLISASMFLVPFDALGVPLNEIQVRVVALFVMAALMWILEPIPIWTTSALTIALCLLFVSNKSFSFAKPDRYDAAVVCQIVDTACTGIDSAVVDKAKADVKAALDKTAKLSPEGIRTTISSTLLKASEKDAANAPQLAAAADKLYQPELNANFGKDNKLAIINLMQQKGIMATTADPIIFLFLGGFFLAAASTKYRLDLNLARVLLKPFGTNPKYVMLGLMIITATFSMFMSNTATCAMMLAIVAPVLAMFDPKDKGRMAFAMSIPVAANVGGIGSPIGAPPNAIARKAIQDMGLDVSFAKWMMFGVPFVIVMILFAWLLLIKLMPIERKELKLDMGGQFLKTPKAFVVYITFAVTVFLWVFGDAFGLDSNTIAIIPIATFAVTGVITAKDFNSMGWDVLWLVAGGFALGLALQDTSLAADLISAIPFGEWPFLVLMGGACFICIFMSTFMSNTAMAALLMPIMAAVGGGMLSAGAIDGSVCTGLLASVALAASLAMALPISTPPNALAYATGTIDTKTMAIPGVIIGVVGLTVAISMCYMLGAVGFFG